MLKFAACLMVLVAIASGNQGGGSISGSQGNQLRRGAMPMDNENDGVSQPPIPQPQIQFDSISVRTMPWIVRQLGPSNTKEARRQYPSCR